MKRILLGGRKFNMKVLENGAVITRAFNNNLALVKIKGKEKIIFSKGIGFGKKFGDKIEAGTQYDKIFSLEDEENVRNLEKVVERVNDEFFAICEEAILDISKEVKGELSENIHVGLIDHLFFAVKRIESNEEIQNPFLNEIEAFYEKEFKLAKMVAEKVGQAVNVIIPEGEIGFITLHIHSAINDGQLSNTMKCNYLSNTLVEYVEDNLKIEIDRKSIDYNRFITHIRFALQRILRSEKVKNDLADIIEVKYPLSFNIAKECGGIIEKYLLFKVSYEEIAYLALHIERFRVSLN